MIPRFIGALALLATACGPANAQTSCIPNGAAMAFFEAETMVQVSVGESDDGTLTAVYASDNHAKWVLLTITPDGSFCLIDKGRSWRNLVVGKRS